MIIINIRKIMLEKKISPEMIAPYVGMSSRSVYHIFEGKKCPTICELELFASALGVRIEDLYDSELSKNHKNNIN